MSSEAGHDPELLRRVEDAFDVYVAQLFDGTAPEREAYLSGVDVDLREGVSELIDQYAEIRRRVDSGPRGFGVGREVGHYHLEREIGRGAMGIVYEAHDLVLDRAVAIKLLYPIYSMTEHLLERFRREASAGGRLSHRGIVQVHEIGEDEGTHFIALELVRGGSIEQYFASLRGRRHLPGDHSVRMARLMAETAEAVAVAHAAGVVHRDLKPANLLLTEEGNPKVADFGLAWIEDELSHTGTGVSTGTPFYMSPEQADPRIGKVGTHTDVFSLGVTLYEALTLERPFQGDTRQQVANKILHQDPIDPRRLRSRIPRDLAIVCLKALEKNPADRYPSARELAADLRRFLADEPILAKPPSKLSLALKWCRRHKAVTSAGVVLVVALLVVSSLMLSLRVSNRRNEQTLRHVIPLVRALDSPDQLDDDELRELLAFALDELESRPEHQLHWLSVLGRELARQGRYEAATPALERAWQVAERSGSTTGPESARLGADLARCLLQTGRVAEAEILLRGLLVEHRDALGEPERVELQGELLQALLDDEDPGPLRAFELEFGRPQEILERLYALRSKHAGNASPEALAALLLLARFHTRTGNVEKAAGLLEESQGSFYRALPSTHQLVLQHQLRLAQAREALGRSDLARRIVDELAERVGSSDAVLDEVRTGEFHVLAGRLNAKEERYQQAVDAYRTAAERAPEGELGVAARRGLGNALLELALVGQLPLDSPVPGALLLEAEARLQDALVLQRRDASAEPALETGILSDLAFVALVRGEHAHSADLHEFLLADRARLEALGGEDVYVTHLERAAFAQRGAGAPELALVRQRSAWETARDELGARSDRAFMALLHLARLTHELLDCDVAHALVEAELARELPDAQLDPVWAENLRAAVLFADGAGEEALAQWRRAWERGPQTMGSTLELRHLMALRGIGEYWASQDSPEADFRKWTRTTGLAPLVNSANRLRPARTWTRLETELLRISLSEVD